MVSDEYTVMENARGKSDVLKWFGIKKRKSDGKVEQSCAVCSVSSGLIWELSVWTSSCWFFFKETASFFWMFSWIFSPKTELLKNMWMYLKYFYIFQSGLEKSFGVVCKRCFNWFSQYSSWSTSMAILYSSVLYIIWWGCGEVILGLQTFYDKKRH